MKNPVVIGSAFIGPASHKNFTTGEYWAALPEHTPNQERLQSVLIGQSYELAKASARVNELPRDPRAPKPHNWSWSRP